MSYLKIPIDLKAAVSGKLERCSYEESIAQQIMLLIVSRYGEVIGKESYGSVIWELEFSQLVKISDWENKVQESLLQAITTYEQRLKEVTVNVVLSEIDDENKKRYSCTQKSSNNSERKHKFNGPTVLFQHACLYKSVITIIK